MFYMTREEWDYMNDLTRRDRYVDEKAILLLRSYRLTLLDDENKEIFPKMTYAHAWSYSRQHVLGA